MTSKEKSKKKGLDYLAFLYGDNRDYADFVEYAQKYMARNKNARWNPQVAEAKFVILRIPAVEEKSFERYMNRLYETKYESRWSRWWNSQGVPMFIMKMFFWCLRRMGFERVEPKENPVEHLPSLTCHAALLGKRRGNS